MAPEPSRSVPLFSPAALVLRQPVSLRDRIVGSVCVALALGTPLVLWLGVFRGVAFGCERDAPQAEPVCTIRHDYGLFRSASPVPAADARRARVEPHKVRGETTPHCVSTIPRGDGAGVLELSHVSEMHECESDVAALQAFFATPAARSVLLSRDESIAWSYLLLLAAPLWLLLLVSGLFHFETRRITVGRDPDRLVVYERVLRRAFRERTVQTIPLADIRGFTTGSTLRDTTLVAQMHSAPRIELWQSSDKQATAAAAARLEAFLRASRT